MRAPRAGSIFLRRMPFWTAWMKAARFRCALVSCFVRRRPWAACPAMVRTRARAIPASSFRWERLPPTALAEAVWSAAVMPSRRQKTASKPVSGSWAQWPATQVSRVQRS